MPLSWPGQQLGCSNFRNKLYQMFDFRKHLRKKHLWQILKRIWAFRVLFSSFKKLSELCEAHRFFLYKVIRSASVVLEWCKYEVSSIFPNGAFFWDKFELLNTAIFSVRVLGGLAAGSFFKCTHAEKCRFLYLPSPNSLLCLEQL